MNKNGHFGIFGGRYVPETLFSALDDLYKTYIKLKKTPSFRKEFNKLLKDYVGRPTPLTYAKRLSNELGFEVYLKREDLNHTGSHKINNALGQLLVAKHMGKSRIIAETGAGQHGVATATACALFGYECVIYMGSEDVKRQQLNVYRMKLLGATVVSVDAGSKTLKEATTEAIRDWLKNVENTHYIIGSVVGPHPYPSMVREFQSIIGVEAKKQILKERGRLPDGVVACVGGGSNAMGVFSAFVKDVSVKLVAVEGSGLGLDTSEHAAPLSKGRPGILHGALSYLLYSDLGQIELAHSISAGLDYPGVGPELSYLKDEERLTVRAATDETALIGCKWVSQLEGVIPALETSHAFGYLKETKDFKRDDIVILNVSGRGDKDMSTLQNRIELD
ncbi:tryptophan synthase subunit beta [bacterium]|jgi:tryptophan synthase beta chain|nr:tryptophan synthase subunit beta [bacterium]